MHALITAPRLRVTAYRFADPIGARIAISHHSASAVALDVDQRAPEIWFIPLSGVSRSARTLTSGIVM